jgi:hypothetical protein
MLQINKQVVADALPQGPSHQKCESRKNIAHGRSESCCGIFHASVVQVLVNRWPAQYLLQFNKVEERKNAGTSL